MSAYSDLVLATDGLVSYWRLGEASGAAVDLKNAHNGIVTGVTYGATGLLAADGDAACLFDSDGEKVAVASHPDFELTAGVSVEAWVRRTEEATNLPIVHCMTTGGATGFGLQTAGGDELHFSCALVAAGSQPAVGTGFSMGDIWHVVGTFDGAFIRIYQNGVENAFNAQDWTGFPLVAPSGAVVEIGHVPSGSASWRGSIDEVAIYSVALTPEQVNAHYDMGIHGQQGTALSAPRIPRGALVAGRVAGEALSAGRTT